MYTLHREGLPTFIVTAFFIAGLNFGVSKFLPDSPLAHNLALILSIVIAGIVVQFFRKPLRKSITDEGLIIAPADGKVVVIEEVEETEYFNGKRKQISIFMSPFNVHINFNPISGLVTYFKYHPGKYLLAWDPKSSTENERSTIVVKHKNGTEILFRQIAGFLARRIVWYVDSGQPVQQGTEFGFIKFGSRIDIFVPIDTEILVELDQKTKGGITPIAKI